MKVFITGDRSMNEIYPAIVMVEMLKAAHAGSEIVTGDNLGIEILVRSFGELAGVPVEVICGSEWDTRHELLKSLEIGVVAIHGAPFESSVVRSLTSIMPDSELRIVTPADLFV